MSLNIFENVGALVGKALNKYLHKSDAAKALGISERTLYRYIGIYSFVVSNGEWVRNTKKRVVVESGSN